MNVDNQGHHPNDDTTCEDTPHEDTTCGERFRLGSRRLRHPTSGNGLVADVVFSPCGRWLVTGARDDGGIVVFDAKTGCRKWHWENEDQCRLDQFIVTPDSKWVIAIPHGSPWRETLRGWSIESGKPIEWPALNEARAIAFDSAGDKLALSSKERIAVYDFPQRRLLAQLRLPRRFAGESSAGYLRVTNDHCFFATYRGLLLRWSYAKTTSPTTWQFRTDEGPASIGEIAVAPDEHALLVASRGKPVVFDATKTTPRSTSVTCENGPFFLYQLHANSSSWKSRKFVTDDPRTLRFIPGRNSIVFSSRESADTTRSLKYLSLSSPNSRVKVFSEVMDFWRVLKPGPEQDQVAFFAGTTGSGYGHTAVIFDVKQGAVVQRFETTDGSPMCLDISPNRAQLAVAYRDGRVDLFDMKSGERKGDANNCRSAIRRFAIDDAGVFAVALDEHAVHWWRLGKSAASDGRTVVQLRAEEVALTDNGDLLVVTYSDDGQGLSLVRRGESRPRWSVKLAGNRWGDLTVCKDGKAHLLDRASNVDQAFDLETGSALHSSQICGNGYPYFSRTALGALITLQQNDENLLLTMDDGPSVHLSWPGPFDPSVSWLSSLRLNRDDTHLACCFDTCKDGEYSSTAMMWRLDRPDEVRSLNVPYKDGVSSAIAFDHANRCLVASLEDAESSRDGEPFSNLVVIDVESNNEILTIREFDKTEFGLPCYGMQVEFGKRGQLIGCSVDNRVLVWDLPKNGQP